MRVELVEDHDQENSCLLTLTYDSADVDRNKVRHSFPMPKLLVTTRFIKLPVRDFSERAFSVSVMSLKGKIRQGSVATSFPDEQVTSVVEVNPLHQVEEAERIRRRKFEGKDWTLKASRSATFLREFCSPKEAGLPQKPKALMLNSCPPTSPVNIEFKPNHNISCFLGPSPQPKTLTRVTSGTFLNANKSVMSLVDKNISIEPSTGSSFKKKETTIRLEPGAKYTPASMKSACSPKALEKCKPPSQAKPQTANLAVSRRLDYEHQQTD